MLITGWRAADMHEKVFDDFPFAKIEEKEEEERTVRFSVLAFLSTRWVISSFSFRAMLCRACHSNYQFVCLSFFLSLFSSILLALEFLSYMCNVSVTLHSTARSMVCK
jgi:hypothetical protein